jgi:hypothetical protein
VNCQMPDIGEVTQSMFFSNFSGAADCVYIDPKDKQATLRVTWGPVAIEEEQDGDNVTEHTLKIHRATVAIQSGSLPIQLNGKLMDASGRAWSIDEIQGTDRGHTTVRVRYAQTMRVTRAASEKG